MNKKRIAIILELKNRELPYFALLKEMLEAKGHIVKIVSFRSACSVQLLLFRPDIVLVNGLRSDDSYIKQMYIPKRLFKATIVCLYSEQIVYNKTGSIAETYNNPKILKAVDYHIVWGDTFAKALVQIGVEREKIWVLGSLQNDLKYYLAHSEKELRRQISNKYGLDDSKKWSIIADNVLPCLEGLNYQENRERMDTLVAMVAEQNQDTEFIMRLHPESLKHEIDLVKNHLRNIQNIHFINEGHIYIWSILCENMIIAFSTSSITALLNNKNVFSLKLPNVQKSEELYERYYWHRNIIPVYANIEQCAADITLDLQGRYQCPLDVKARCYQYINGFYHTVDGNIFARYVYFFDNIANDYSKPHKEPLYKIIKCLLYDLRGWVGEKLLCKQDVNNVLSKDDYDAVHEIYNVKENPIRLEVILKTYQYIEPKK